MIKYLVTILTSSKIDYLKLALKSVENQKNYNNCDYDIFIVVNTLNDSYYQDVIDEIKIGSNMKLRKIIRTESNGKPGKGHNSLLTIFYNTIEYDNLIILDGDDFLYPEAIQKINNLNNIENFDVLTITGNTKLQKKEKLGNIKDDKIISKKEYFFWEQKNITNLDTDYNKILAVPCRIISLNKKILYEYKELYHEEMYIYDDFLFYIIFYNFILTKNKKYNILHASDSHIYLYNDLNEDSVSNRAHENYKDEEFKDQILASFNLERKYFQPSQLFKLKSYYKNTNYDNFYEYIIENIESKTITKKNIIFIDGGSWNYNNKNYPLGGTESAILYLSEKLEEKGNNILVLTNKDEDLIINPNYKFLSLQRFNKINNYTSFFNNNQENFIITQALPYYDFFSELKNIIDNLKILTWIHHDINVSYIKTNKINHLYDGYIFVSNWQKYRYIQNFDLKDEKCYIMQNAFSPLIYNYDIPIKKEKAIIYCSAPYRGLHLAFELFQIIKRHHPDIKFKIFSCFGRDTIINKESYNEIINLNQLDNFIKSDNDLIYKDFYKKLVNDANIEFYGSVPQKILFEHMKNSMILFYPNTYPETCCSLIFEALINRCNIISSDLGALNETSNGYAKLFNPNLDVNEIDYDLENALNNPITINDVSNNYINKYVTETINTIKNYYSEKNQNKLHKQFEFAKKCNWGNRANEFIEILDSI